MKQPLALRLRPECLDDIIGQEHLTGENKVIRKMIENNQLFSMVLFGTPGTGKTTLATVIARSLNVNYRYFNAVTGNKKELDAIFLEAKLADGLIVIIDEIHRLNKDKQDLLLPHIEDGTITIIGTTTSNPYFALNPAIRSRCHLFEVKPLSEEHIKKAILNAIHKPEGFNNTITIDEDALNIIADHANGDIRYALNILEICAMMDSHITKEIVLSFSRFPNSSMSHDEDGHYDAVSAFQKSIRGSDVNAALYYLARLIQSDDMDSIERRLLVIAYEDIGLANPSACARCVEAIDAARRVGFPEAMIPLSVAVIDLALSPKSKSAELAIQSAMEEVNTHAYQVPDYLKMTPVNLDPKHKYDYADHKSWPYIQYLPDAIKNVKFYTPELTSSYERQLAKNLETLDKITRTNDLSKLK